MGRKITNQVIYDLREMRKYWKLKEEAMDSIS